MSFLLSISQFLFTLIIGIYFLRELNSSRGAAKSMEKESEKEMEKLRMMRRTSLSEPLSEKTRPKSFDEIVGQEDGVCALKASLCGPNPQHVIIYGPAGVGKTAAARAVLKEAVKSAHSPFKLGAPFVEADGATLRFDERGIADPLIGSVHDPIYQGAGSYGNMGVPRPIAGAVTKAHGGILFIDEIGELHPMQINKLLKVLEDRRVMPESSYYSAGNKNIPRHIHDMFKRGMPADFRLIGATTRDPSEIPPAIRSRCVEIFFNALSPEQIGKIARNAISRASFFSSDEVLSQCVKYSQNGRDAVNLVQTAGSLALCGGRREIINTDINHIIASGRYTPRVTVTPTGSGRIGKVYGLAVSPAIGGMVLSIEAYARKNTGKGEISYGGIVEKEEISLSGRTLQRKGTAYVALQNALCALKDIAGINTDDYSIYINFTGGYPADGPSAGCALFMAIYSAVTKTPIPDTIAMTGEISPYGDVLPVGGVPEKVSAAVYNGMKRIFVPNGNIAEAQGRAEPVSHISELIQTIND